MALVEGRDLLPEAVARTTRPIAREAVEPAPHQVPESYTQAYPNLKGERQLYAGMVAAMDEAIGQITAALDEKGLRQNTLILFASDNGG